MTYEATSRPIRPSTEFAIELFQTIFTPSSNTLISPIGLRTLLSMLWAGASGDSRRELENSLKLRESRTTFHRFEDSGIPWDGNEVMLGEDEVLEIANALWLNSQFQLNSDFAGRMRTTYKAQLHALDFVQPGSSAIINEWCSRNTGGLIPSIINPDMLNGLTMLLGTNAIYFKGKWKNPFEQTATKQDSFHLLSGDTNEVWMMSRSGEYHYLETEELQAVSLPYRGSIEMLLLLPVSGKDFRQFCSTLTPVHLEDWDSKLEWRPGRVSLPKFHFESTMTLTNAAKSMGITRIFEAERAALDLISSQPIFVESLVQKAKIEVEEKGTKAAAVSSAHALLSRALPQFEPKPPFVMILNRPFLFFVRHKSSRLVFFLGAVVDPHST